MTSARPVYAIAMCGLAFSGKSTAARRVADALGFALIVLDRINEERRLDGGAGLTVEQWEETSAIAMGRLGATLAAGQSAVVDDTPLERIEQRRAANLANPIRPHISDHVFAAHRDGFQFPEVYEPGVVTIKSDADLERWLEYGRNPETLMGLLGGRKGAG